MVLLHVKKSEEHQFLYETTVVASVSAATAELCEVSRDDEGCRRPAHAEQQAVTFSFRSTLGVDCPCVAPSDKCRRSLNSAVSAICDRADASGEKGWFEWPSEEGKRVGQKVPPVGGRAGLPNEAFSRQSDSYLFPPNLLATGIPAS